MAFSPFHKNRMLSSFHRKSFSKSVGLLFIGEQKRGPRALSRTVAGLFADE
jgi:hypothetical protein